MLFLVPNQKKLLNSFNPLFIAMFVGLCVLIRTTLDPLFGGMVRSTDVMLAVSVYIGQRRGLIEGIILTLFTSHLYSLCSGAPIGVFATNYLIIFFMSRFEGRLVNSQNWVTTLASLFMFAIISRFTLTLVSQFFGHGWLLFTFSNFSIGKIIWSTLSGWIIFGLLNRIDEFTFKTTPANIEIGQ